MYTIMHDTLPSLNFLKNLYVYYHEQYTPHMYTLMHDTLPLFYRTRYYDTCAHKLS